MTNRRTFILLAAPLASLFLISNAVTGEVPATAYSGRLLQPPEFLDYPSLVFEYPQMASAFRSQVLALAPSSNLSAGALLRTGSSGWFALSQRMAGYNVPGPNGVPMVFQAGWGTRLRPVRFGLAMRGTEDRSFQGGDSSELKWIEGSAGIGFANRAVALDAAVDVRHENRLATDCAAGLTTSAHGQASGVASLAARGALALGRHTDLLAAGQWSRLERDWSFQAGSSSPSDRSFDDLAESSFAALGVAGPVGIVNRITASVMYQNRDQRIVTVSSGDFARRRTVTRSADAAVSAEEQIWRHLNGGAGFRLERADENITDRGRPSSRRIGLSESFAWGLAYEWRNVRLAGSVHTKLRLLSPFYALDVLVGI